MSRDKIARGLRKAADVADEVARWSTLLRQAAELVLHQEARS